MSIPPRPPLPWKLQQFHGPTAFFFPSPMLFPSRRALLKNDIVPRPVVVEPKATSRRFPTLKTRELFFQLRMLSIDQLGKLLLLYLCPCADVDENVCTNFVSCPPLALALLLSYVRAADYSVSFFGLRLSRRSPAFSPLGSAELKKDFSFLVFFSFSLPFLFWWQGPYRVGLDRSASALFFL